MKTLNNLAFFGFYAAGILFFAAPPSLEAGEVRFPSCPWSLRSRPTSERLAQASEANAARYSKLIEALGLALAQTQAIRLEHVPRSTTLSSSAKVRIRRAPRPVLQSLQIYDSRSGLALLGGLRFRLHREGTAVRLEIGEMTLSAEYVPEWDTIRLALLSKLLSQDPEIEALTLRTSIEAIDAIRAALDRVDPKLRRNPNLLKSIAKSLQQPEPRFGIQNPLAAALPRELRNRIALETEDAGPSSLSPRLADLVLEAIRLAPRKNGMTIARVTELLQPPITMEERLEDSEIARLKRSGRIETAGASSRAETAPSLSNPDLAALALSETSEAQLARILGFDTLLNVRTGGEVFELTYVKANREPASPPSTPH